MGKEGNIMHHYLFNSVQEFDIVRMRIYEVTNCSTMIELAQYLGVSQSAIVDAHRQYCLPDEWIRTISKKTKISSVNLLEGWSGRIVDMKPSK